MKCEKFSLGGWIFPPRGLITVSSSKNVSAKNSWSVLPWLRHRSRTPVSHPGSPPEAKMPDLFSGLGDAQKPAVFNQRTNCSVTFNCAKISRRHSIMRNRIIAYGKIQYTETEHFHGNDLSLMWLLTCCVMYFGNYEDLSCTLWFMQTDQSGASAKHYTVNSSARPSLCLSVINTSVG